MKVRFAHKDLDRLETDPSFDAGFSAVIVSRYRMRMQSIRAAVDERAFYAMKSLHFEQLQGKRSHQHSMKLNDQWRLILETEGKGKEKVIIIVKIEDYH